MKRSARIGRRPVRRLFLIAGAVAVFATAPLSFASPAKAAATATASGQGIDDFYAAQGGQLLWLRAGQADAARELLGLLETAEADGLDPGKYKVKSLAKAVEKASGGGPGQVRKADEMLSEAFVAYARDLRIAPAAGMRFADPRLRPGPPSPRALLLMAQSAPPLTVFVNSMGWMNPAYAPLRRALVRRSFETDRQRDLLQVNLERARVLPGKRARYVIVNAAAQRLDMYEDGKLVDSMRVVVGRERPKDRTPMLASFLTHASLNPYWNVPADLAAERIAPNVVKQGLGYLKRHGYELLSDWGDNATLVDPATVDWQAVADGRVEVRLRQLPGKGNSLGKVKFTFPNSFGV
ncbi:MAG: L,D-transpeptidase family protein, partial [Sphingomonas sp.]|nr:L,D-transpeptidase family protein [Sphingomonas sp.]